MLGIVLGSGPGSGVKVEHPALGQCGFTQVDARPNQSTASTHIAFDQSDQDYFGFTLPRAQLLSGEGEVAGVEVGTATLLAAPKVS